MSKRKNSNKKSNDSLKKDSSKEDEPKKQGFSLELNKKQMQYLIFGLCAALIVSVALNVRGMAGLTGMASAGAVSENTLNLLNILPAVTQSGEQVSLDSIDEFHGLYLVETSWQGQSINVYISPDGEYIFFSEPSGIEELKSEIEGAGTQVPQEIPKSDKPTVELFVMSHCPYGTQAEKGIIPAVEELGDKIDFEIKWVYYTMHGETEANEQLLQECIKTDYGNSGHIDYLKCFLEDGNTTRCIVDMGYDMDSLDICVENLRAQYNITSDSAMFPVYLAENEQYGIGGSPTLVINGMPASSSRSPAAYLATICSAFNNAPSECETELSATSPSSGFGWDGQGTDSGSC